MDFVAQLDAAPLVLTGGSMYERLRRNPEVVFDEEIKHAGLIYGDSGRAVLDAVHREYIAVAKRHRLPMIVGASTWRASKERIERSAWSKKRVNQDNVAFVREIAASEASRDAPLLVAAMMGCRGDAYRPDEKLEYAEAVAFHAFQVGAIVEAEPDVVIAATLPALSEARGIAKCLEDSGLPYLLSFVVRDSGALLDGTPLGLALDTIDQERARGPVGYMVNCVHPSVLERCLDVAGPAVSGRVIGLRANTATLRPEELDSVDELVTQPAAELAASMRSAQRLGLGILGGCCGTDTSHLEAIATVCKEPT